MVSEESVRKAKAKETARARGRGKAREKAAASPAHQDHLAQAQVALVAAAMATTSSCSVMSACGGKPSVHSGSASAGHYSTTSRASARPCSLRLRAYLLRVIDPYP